MQTDLPADFLHLYHAFDARGDQLARLLDHFGGDAGIIRHARPARLREVGLGADRVERIVGPADARVGRDLEWAAQPNHHLVTIHDSRYPALLRELTDYPPLLYARGNVDLLSAAQIAIVGSRRCTPGGAQSAKEFAAALAEAGLAVTSGLAIGIDAAAHRGALAVDGDTVAVLGCGIDRWYPVGNRQLGESIAAQGLVISEFPPGMPAARANFPRRNRIVSGLSVATLVVEAAERSGSLISARLAAEQGREVFAVPGSIHNPMTRGCHRLIRDGATLVEEPADITRELSSLLGFACAARRTARTAPETDLDASLTGLLEAMGFDPVTADTLVSRTGLTSDKVSSMLVNLELKDLIRSAPGGCFVRIQTRYS